MIPDNRSASVSQNLPSMQALNTEANGALPSSNTHAGSRRVGLAEYDRDDGNTLKIAQSESV